MTWYSNKELPTPYRLNCETWAYHKQKVYNIITTDGIMHTVTFNRMCYGGWAGEEVFNVCMVKVVQGEYIIHDSIDWYFTVDDVLYWRELPPPPPYEPVKPMF